MEISSEARERLNSRVARIVRDLDIYDADKDEITRELTSNFYDHSMMHASERGSTTIEKQDIEAVFAESEDPREIAVEYMRSYVSMLERAGIVSRTVAFLLDIIMLAVCLMVLILVITLPFVAVFPDDLKFLPSTTHDPFGGVHFSPQGLAGFLYLGLTGLTSLVVVLTYFIVIEGRFGFTPGKWLLGLRVLREDGTRIGYTESIIRNIPKIVGNSLFIVIDALLMIFLFGKEKQRGFDKIARTIVVHKNRKAPAKEAK